MTQLITLTYMSTSETPKSPFTLSQPIGFGESLFNLPHIINKSANNTTSSFKSKTPSMDTLTATPTFRSGSGIAQIVGSNKGGKITLKLTVPSPNGSICEIHSHDGFTHGPHSNYVVTLTPANATAATANTKIYCDVISNKHFDIILCGDEIKCFATYEWFYSITPY
jgi:hypothetical protein